jgi:hypothetical protein
MFLNRHTKDKAPILVANALGQVDVAGAAIAFSIGEGATQDRDALVTLNREPDVLARVGKPYGRRSEA